MAGNFRKKWLAVVAICAILLVGGIGNAAWQGGYTGAYGLMTVWWNQDGYNDTSEWLWAYYVAATGVADYAWIYAYLGMGLDLLPYFGNYRAYGYHPNLYITNDGAGALGWSDGFSIWLNSYYMCTVTTSDWGSVLATEAWYKGSTISHETSHVFYRQVTGHLISSYWDNMLTESLAHYVGNCVWPWQDPDETGSTSGYRPANWSDIAWQTLIASNWDWESIDYGDYYNGWNDIGTWSQIATTYNYGGSYTWEDRLHFWAFGYFLANYMDFQTNFTGVFGSSGYSPLGGYGWGGSWNVAGVLLLMGPEYGYSVQNALSFVYSPSGRSYTADLYSMSSAQYDNSLNCRYYWYWWVLAYIC